MASLPDTTTASLTIAELREFAGFGAKSQRYIKRSLDVGLGRHNAFELWARDADETASIRTQYLMYQDLADLRDNIPDSKHSPHSGAFMAKLVRLAAFDLAQEKLACFSAFRFLYERLISADVRPWLPSAYCAAAALPQIEPSRRKLLLQSISEAAATAPGWSTRAPVFYPEWVDDVKVAAG
ncbi:hypothetical protein [Sphingorhabdus sp. Alg239-R122]|uniref:hypothetical protein n=1 Tax=Sphingorhabdus sp. Alg239-R122 TaxID=2305989 RepID=UPI0013D9A37B|nr:hypothetical protein [Sphingorhabdus sp. Alg239-R122]